MKAFKKQKQIHKPKGDILRGCRITDGSKLGLLLQRYYDRMVRKYPLVILVTGEVGTGKSRSLLLNILDYWYKKFFSIEPPAKFLSADLLHYSAGLKEAKPMNMVVLDEAIDAFGKGSSNRRIVNAFQNMFGICRERQVATTIVLDDVFIITSKLTKYVTCWIHAETRIDNKCSECNKRFAGFKECPYCGSKRYMQGVVKYRVYSRKRLREIIRQNETKQTKSLYVKGVRPHFKSYIMEYRGHLEETYKLIKDNKTNETMEELIKTIRVKKKELKEVEKKFKGDEQSNNQT